VEFTFHFIVYAVNRLDIGVFMVPGITIRSFRLLASGKGTIIAQRSASPKDPEICHALKCKGGIKEPKKKKNKQRLNPHNETSLAARVPGSVRRHGRTLSWRKGRIVPRKPAFSTVRQFPSHWFVISGKWDKDMRRSFAES
jgi:hypothetical protein